MGKRGAVLIVVLALTIGFSVGMYKMFTGMMPIMRGFYTEAKAADYTYQTYGFNETGTNILDEIQGVDGVESLEARLMFQVPIHLEGKEQTLQLMLLGVNTTGFNASQNLDVYSYDIQAGENLVPSDTNALILTKEFFEKNALTLDQTIKIESLDNRSFTLKGSAFDIEFIMVNTMPEVMFPIKGTMGVAIMNATYLRETVTDTNPNLFYPYLQYEYNEIQVTMEPGANQTQVNDKIEAILDAHSIQRISSTSFEDSYAWKMFKADLEGSTQFMYALMILALVMAFTLSLSIFIGFARSQKSQVGTLGSLGYSKREIAGGFFMLALEVSLIATVLSTVIAYGLMQGMMMELGGSIFGVSVSFPFTYDIIWLSFLICIGLALVSMWLPLNKMMKQDMAVLIYHKEDLTTRISRKDKVSTRRPSRKLIWRGLLRHPKKTTLNLIGVAFSLIIVGGALFMWGSLQYTTTEKYPQNERWDVTVSFASPLSSSAQSIQDISTKTGVQTLETALKWQVLMENPNKDVNNFTSFLLGVPNPFSQHHYDIKDGRLPETDREVLVTTLTRNALELALGDNMTIHTPQGLVRNYTVVGFSEEVTMMSYVTLKGLQDFTGEPGLVNVAFITFTGGTTTTQVDQKIQEIYKLSDDIAVIQSRAQIVTNIQFYANEIISFIYIVVGFAILVEFFVIYNATLMSIGDHENEYGVLRSLGFRKRRIYLQVISENLFPLAVSIAFGLWFIPYIGNWLISLYEDQFAFFPVYPIWIYIFVLIAPILVTLWATRSGMKYIYGKSLYEQVQTQFVA